MALQLKTNLPRSGTLFTAAALLTTALSTPRPLQGASPVGVPDYTARTSQLLPTAGPDTITSLHNLDPAILLQVKSRALARVTFAESGQPLTIVPEEIDRLAVSYLRFQDTTFELQALLDERLLRVSSATSTDRKEALLGFIARDFQRLTETLGEDALKVQLASKSFAEALRNSNYDEAMKVVHTVVAAHFPDGRMVATPSTSQWLLVQQALKGFSIQASRLDRIELLQTLDLVFPQHTVGERRSAFLSETPEVALKALNDERSFVDECVQALGIGK
jgi:hypothetical protein